MKRKAPKRLKKFNNSPTEIDGIKFDSKKEALRYCELRLMEKAKIISDLKMQVRFPLNVNDVIVGHYVADFVYVENGATIVEDVKSPVTRTAVYNLKKKILATYDPPILIHET